MTIHEQKLSALAKQMPMFATELVAAADNIKELKGAIWAVRPDVNKIKADAVRDACENVNNALDATNQDEWLSRMTQEANNMRKGE